MNVCEICKKSSFTFVNGICKTCSNKTCKTCKKYSNNLVDDICLDCCECYGNFICDNHIKSANICTCDINNFCEICSNSLIDCKRLRKPGSAI